MKNEQKLLLFGGLILLVACAFYLAGASVPNNATSALLFPMSILGLLFGAIFVVWGLGWIVLQRTKVLK